MIKAVLTYQVTRNTVDWMDLMEVLLTRSLFFLVVQQDAVKLKRTATFVNLGDQQHSYATGVEHMRQLK